VSTLPDQVFEKIDATHAWHANVGNETRTLTQVIRPKKVLGGCKGVRNVAMELEKPAQCTPNRLVVVDDRYFGVLQPANPLQCRRGARLAVRSLVTPLASELHTRGPFCEDILRFVGF
jgi:hypothetical protein